MGEGRKSTPDLEFREQMHGVTYIVTHLILLDTSDTAALIYSDHIKGETTKFKHPMVTCW